MSGNPAARAARSLWAASVGLAAAAGVFLVLGWDAPQPPNAFGFRGFSALAAAAFGTVGALVASRHPRNPNGWILCAMGVGSGAQEAAQQYAMYAVLSDPGALPGGEIAAWIPHWIWIPVYLGGFLALFLLFPDGHPRSARWAAVGWVGGVSGAIAALSQSLFPGPLDTFAPVRNPFGVTGALAILDPVSTVTILLLAICMLAAAGSLGLRLRTARGDERAQLRWMASAGLLLAMAVLAFLSVALFVQATGPLVDGLEIAVILAVVGVPVAGGIAILRYRLYDIDVVINKAVVFGVLAAFITAAYIGIVVGIGAALGGRLDVGLSAVAAAIVALAFQPVRRRAQRLANRLVYGQRATPYEVLSEFSRRMAGTYATDDVLPRMARILGQGVGAAQAQVWLRVGSQLRLAAAWPRDPAPDRLELHGDELPEIPAASTAAPVVYREELLGALAVAKPPSEPLTPAEGKLVSDIASQAGLVLRTIRLLEELRESRRRIVSAQDERAKKLERNLHDGAQQQLVALAVKLRLAESAAAKEAPQLAATLAQVQAEAQDALENLRDLARGIYPPLLADKGLPAALEAQARKSPVPTEVETDGIGRYPQEVEAAVYFCVLEALQNAAKYAGASRVTVRLRDHDGSLGFEVQDDGHGFDPSTTPPGSGLQNMADRLEALGGLLDITSAPGSGTTVHGALAARGDTR